MTVYHFFVTNGLWHYFVGALIGTLFALVVRPASKRAWHEAMSLLRTSADRLDTDTDGGLGQIQEDLDEIKGELVRIRNGMGSWWLRPR